MNEDAAQTGAMKQKIAELEKKLSDKDDQHKQVLGLRAQAQEIQKQAEAKAKQMAALRDLALKHLGEKEQELEDLKKEMVKCREEAAKAANAGNAAALKKAEDDLGAARQMADKAMAQAIDFQRGCNSLIKQNNATKSKNQELERVARERAFRSRPLLRRP